MPEQFEQKIGRFNGRTHLLYWEARPNLDELDAFVVNISYADLSGSGPRRVQIVRIDNVDKPLHMDELWKDGQPKRWLDWPGTRWERFGRALAELHDNWRRYARRWSRHRGY